MRLHDPGTTMEQRAADMRASVLRFVAEHPALPSDAVARAVSGDAPSYRRACLALADLFDDGLLVARFDPSTGRIGVLAVARPN